MVFRYVALIGCLLVMFYALERYHRRRGVELEKRHAKHHGWEKTTLSVRQETWKCPRCRVPLLTWDDVLAHRFGMESPCAELEELQANQAKQDEAQAATEAAQTAGRWSASAEVVAESHAGGVDTWDRPELEGAEDGQG